MDKIRVRKCEYQIRLQLTSAEGEAKSSRVDSVFCWWSKCISSTISRTASRNTLFSSARISKMINVDRAGPSLNDYSQDNARYDSRGEDLQAPYIDDSDLMISNQDFIKL